MICINPFNDLSNRYVEAIEKVRRKEDGGAQTGQSRVVGLGAKVRRRGAASGWECGRRCADGTKPDRGVGRKSVQAWRGSRVGMRAKARRRGKAGSWGWARKCADGARLVRGSAGEGAQTWGGSCVVMQRKVHRLGTAHAWESGEGAQTGRGSCVGMRAKVRRWGKAGSWGWARKWVWVRAVWSSESIGAYRNQSEFIGGARLSSDLF